MSYIHRHRGNRRRVKRAQQERKRKICKYVLHFHEEHLDKETTVGKLAKGKVHCSCPLCAAKSKKTAGVIDHSIKNWKATDQRKIMRAREAIANVNDALDEIHEGEAV